MFSKLSITASVLIALVSLSGPHVVTSTILGNRCGMQNQGTVVCCKSQTTSRYYVEETWLTDNTKPGPPEGPDTACAKSSYDLGWCVSSALDTFPSRR
jgi:hypothetical protein